MSDRYLTVLELRASADHNLTDSRTKSQLYWAADRIEQLEAELRLVAGWFVKGDDGGLLIDHGGGWVSGVEFPNLSTYIDEVQP